MRLHCANFSTTIQVASFHMDDLPHSYVSMVTCLESSLDPMRFVSLAEEFSVLSADLVGHGGSVDRLRVLEGSVWTGR
ncbi:hypothetical protein RRG08_030015 [Elysia crispata]|uniref:Uncharacterized protein n=1 Tax=Elysia crispata TaxID=231223 RepID=A0AAE0XYI5_9GAST|nr:hypothetical protein RRG08_030015 [Elysia crispata]